VKHKAMNDSLKECSDKIEHLLKLFTAPIGVKLFKSIAELPEEAQRTDRKCTVCQLVAFTRMDIKFQDKVIYATEDDILCALGGSALGFYELPEDMASGERALQVYSDNVEANKKMMSDVIRIEPGQHQGILVAPLSKMSISPDVILVFCASSQMVRFAYAASWRNGRLLECKTNGHQGICSEAIAAPYLLREPRIALPCYGSHRFALVRDEEFVFGFPAELLEEITFGLERSHELGQGYPIRRFGLTVPPPEMQARIVKKR